MTKTVQQNFFINLGLGIGLVVLLAISIGTYINTVSLTNKSEWVRQTQEISQRLEGLRSSLRETETEERGFLLTGKDNDVALHDKTVQSIHQNLADLRHLTADNPAQQHRLDQLTPLVALRLSQIDSAILVRKSKGFEAALNMVQTNLDNATMDSIRQILTQLHNEETAILVKRTDAERDKTTSFMQFLIAGTVLGVMIFLAIIFFLKSEIKKRHKAEAALQAALEHEASLSRTDYLTGAANKRSFYESASVELDRSRRYARPFAIAYIDCDNFKYVNDHLGHYAGDEVLKTVSQTAKSILRATDFFARMGGDEFAVLFRETSDEAVQLAVPKLQRAFLEAMTSHNWPITFSIGTVTFLSPPESIDAMLNIADSLMYDVKQSTKNNAKYLTYRKQPSVSLD
jgi:diguanylate cyclase (GGDEF)-like protein